MLDVSLLVDIGAESLALFEENSIAANLITRKLEPFNTNLCHSRPHWFEYLNSHWMHWYISANVKEGFTLKDFMQIYAEPGIRGITRDVDKYIVEQITNNLLNSRTVMPVSIVGIESCMSWLKERFKFSRTKTADRCLILTPKSETVLIKSLMSKLLLDSYDEFNTYLFTRLEGYNIAIQKDAVVLASLVLPEIPDPDYSYAKSMDYQGFALRVQIGKQTKENKIPIKIDCAFKVTKVNNLHCELIPEEAFCASLA